MAHATGGVHRASGEEMCQPDQDEDLNDLTGRSFEKRELPVLHQDQRASISFIIHWLFTEGSQ